jgi:hypothetical protein
VRNGGQFSFGRPARPGALAQLLADAREACQQLWADVAALLQKVSVPK